MLSVKLKTALAVKFKKLIPLFVCAALICALIIFPERYSAACASGVRLWANYVLPSLFPFLFLTKLMSKLNGLSAAAKFLSPVTKTLFGLDGVAAYALLMSVSSGYPVGSKLVYDLHYNKIIDDSQATKMSGLCSSSGPLFIIGSVGGGMFLSVRVGAVLFLSHLAALLVCGVAFRFYKTERVVNTPLNALRSGDNLLGECVYDSVLSILLIGGYITLFYLLAQVLCDFYVLQPVAFIFEGLLRPIGANESVVQGFCEGLIEVTRGSKLLSDCTGLLPVCICSALISFGGLSAICQQLYYLKKANVRLRVFFAAKLLQAVISFFVCLALGRLIL